MGVSKRKKREPIYYPLLLKGRRRWKEDDKILWGKEIYHGIPPALGKTEIQTDSIVLQFFEKELRKHYEQKNPKQDITEKKELDYETHHYFQTSKAYKGQLYDVWIVRYKNGRFGVRKRRTTNPFVERLNFHMKTFENLSAYGIPQAERKARRKLLTYLNDWQKDTLLLSQTICEIGRSGVVYYIRINKPTLAFRPRPDRDEANFLCSMCLHPLAYYSGSWAGTLCPSDEMLSHLLLIRSNEHFFWRKANQYPMSAEQSGI